MLIIFINKLVNSIKSKRDKTIIFYYNNRILEFKKESTKGLLPGIRKSSFFICRPLL